MATAMIHDNNVANVDGVSVHDIEFLSIGSNYNGAVRLRGGQGSGVVRDLAIRNATLELATDAAIEIEGSTGTNPGYMVLNNQVHCTRVGVYVVSGHINVRGNQFIDCSTAIQDSGTLFSTPVIGHNDFRNCTTHFVNLDGADGLNEHFDEMQIVTFTRPGTLVTGTGTAEFRFPDIGRVISAWMVAGTAGTGTGENIIDVNLNGTTMFDLPGDRPAMATGVTSSGTEGCGGNTAVGDILTVDVDGVTATTPAEDVVVSVMYVLLPAS